MSTNLAQKLLLCGAALAVTACADTAVPSGPASLAPAAVNAPDPPLDLGTLGGQGSSAADINDARVVVGSSDVSGEVHAFRWTREHGMRSLPGLGGRYTAALSINKTGYVLGLSRDPADALHIVIWTPPTGKLVDLGRPPGTDDFFVRGFNDRNEVVGDLYGETTLPHQFKWSRKTGYTEVYPYRPNWETYVSAIGNDGSLVGSACCVGVPYYGWFLSTPADGFLALGAPGGMNGGATGLNDRHQVIGWDNGGMGNPIPYPDYWTASFVWTPGAGYTYLGTLGGWDGSPTAINNRGEIVGSSTTLPMDDSDPFTGYYYSPSRGMLRLQGWSGGLTGAAAINIDGWIVGSAQTASGAWHAALWRRPSQGAAALTATSAHLGASGRFGLCLGDRDVFESPMRIGHCLVEGVVAAKAIH